MLANRPTVSVIVPTYNNQATIGPCLEAILQQSMSPDEVIVVDNFSTDLTRAIASRFGVVIVTHGSERCEQANYGVEMAKGDYVLRMDADLVLEESVIEDCLGAVERGCEAVEVHNSPDPQISWIARARRFEYDLLRGDIRRVSARFVKRELYRDVGGLNPRLIAGEDYDFQDRLNEKGIRTGFIEAQAISISEPTSLMRMARKHFRYGRQAVEYRRLQQCLGSTRKTGKLDAASVLQKLYLRKWKAYTNDPVSGLLFVLYFTVKVCAGGAGFLFETGYRLRCATQ